MKELKIGKNIKMLRELKNIPRKNMADKLKMTEEGLARIERDEVDVNISKSAR